MRGSLVAHLWPHCLILEWGINAKNCPIQADAITLEALLLGSLKEAGHQSYPERPLLLLEVQKSSISLGQILGKFPELLSPANDGSRRLPRNFKPHLLLPSCCNIIKVFLVNLFQYINLCTIMSGILPRHSASLQHLERELRNFSVV